ncbi:MAG: AAA family ATPase [bacterium]
MACSFNTEPRYYPVRYYRLLTSPVVIAALIIIAIAAAISWLLLIFITTSPLVINVVIISSSLSAGLALLVIFATTYFPYLASPNSVQELKAFSSKRAVNVAQAASFSLLLIFGRHTLKHDHASLERAIQSLAESPAVDYLLKRLQINEEKVIGAIRQSVLPKLDWPEFSRHMLFLAASLKHPVITPEHALGALLLHPGLRKQLRAVELTKRDVLFTLWWVTEQHRRSLARGRWWDEGNLLAFTGLGLSWASGYTPFVDRFTRIPSGSIWDDIIYGHETKVTEIINTLARQRQSNVLLVGDPGVGRLGIVRQLAWRVSTSSAHPALAGQRVLYINVGELLAQGDSSATQMSIVSRALREMEQADNIIAVIDGLSSALGQSSEQRVNLTDILLPFLASMTVRVLVIISSDDYHLRFKSNQQLAHYFEIVQVESLSEEDTLKRLALSAPAIEREAGLFIPYKTIQTLIEDTSPIMPDIPFPERAFDFLEEAIVVAQTEGAAALTPSHIEQLISRKIGLNLGDIKANEKQQLLGLEQLMHRRLVNQEAAVTTVAHAMIRARAEVRSTKRPIGVFLFLGPTGVGKTETAKTLAEVYFGSEEHMVRLDMSEFQGQDALSRLIGSVDHPVGRLTSLIADHPFTVLLLDEFEKADQSVHQLFLQVFDEGHLTDARGRKYSFQHTIIIATSNAGAELIRTAAKGGKVPVGFEEQLKEYILSNNILRPELLNRFDGVITYATLSRQHIRQITVLMLRGLNKRLDAEHGITIAITDELVDFLVKIGYNPEFGARPMTRAIQDTVEYAVAQKIIKGETEPGQKITLLPATLFSK